MKKFIFLLLLTLVLGGCSVPSKKSEIKSQTREISLGADSGAKSPGTVSEFYEPDSYAWDNIDNIKVSDNNYATVVVEEENYPGRLQATNFGFTIPPNSVINGILTEIEGKTLENSEVYLNLNILGLSAEGSPSNDNFLSTNENYISFGGITDLWENTGINASEINDSSFGVEFGLSDPVIDTYYIDHIRMTVYYTEEATTQDDIHIKSPIIFE